MRINYSSATGLPKTDSGRDLVEGKSGKMGYSDLWNNNLLHRLPEEFAEGKLMRIVPPSLYVDKMGNTVFPKTRSFPPIAKDVTRLEVVNHDFPGSVGFHEGIRWLDISRSACDGEFVFPKSLEVLVWRDSNCQWYDGKFSHLPNLKQLDWSHRPIDYLPKLPKTLKVLQLQNCTELTSLPELPEGLRVLDIRGCKKLKTLPEIPASVQEIWCEGCSNLRPRYIVEDAFSYWNVPRWFREYQQKESRERVQKRTRELRQEIVAAAYHPRRVERWLEQRGWDILEEMMG